MRNGRMIASIVVGVLSGVFALNRAGDRAFAPSPATPSENLLHLPAANELHGNNAASSCVPAASSAPAIPVSLPSSTAEKTNVAKHGSLSMLACVTPIAGSVVPIVLRSPPWEIGEIMGWAKDIRSPQNKHDIGKSSINFTRPAGLEVTGQLSNGAFDTKVKVIAPKAATFQQGKVYRLRLKRALPDKSNRAFYPTLEVVPATSKTASFLQHASVPITFSDADFTEAKAGILVVKVIYLPDPSDSDTITEAQELKTTQFDESGVDPVVEAQRRGTILAIIRMGNIDLEK